jgi:hypothetical protein
VIFLETDGWPYLLIDPQQFLMRRRPGGVADLSGVLLLFLSSVGGWKRSDTSINDARNWLCRVVDFANSSRTPFVMRDTPPGRVRFELDARAGELSQEERAILLLEQPFQLLLMLVTGKTVSHYRVL